MNFLITKQIIKASLITALLTILLVFGFSLYQQKQIRNTSNMLSRSRVVLTTLRNLMTASMDIQNGARTFVLTGNAQHLLQTEVGKDSIHRQIAILRSSIADNPNQLKWIDSLDKYVKYVFKMQKS
ncbi:MAG: CHASE3 domain-containing protein [Chitinophagaceae bacterium]|nr:CHASE3 domain-containing protein [Chitinophagaceae bacterium]